jgi:excisionase family DNA binding protein
MPKKKYEGAMLVPDEEPRRPALSQLRPVPRRGLSRIEAAMYLGISPSKFDKMVEDGRAPQPRLIDGRKVWDSRA